MWRSRPRRALFSGQGANADTEHRGLVRSRAHYVDGRDGRATKKTLVIAQSGANNLLDVFGQGLELSGPGMAAIGTCDGHVRNALHDERAAGVLAFRAGDPEWPVCVGHAGRFPLGALSESGAASFAKKAAQFVAPIKKSLRAGPSFRATPE
jgi:hypothetical protein